MKKVSFQIELRTSIFERKDYEILISIGQNDTYKPRDAKKTIRDTKKTMMIDTIYPSSDSDILQRKCFGQQYQKLFVSLRTCRQSFSISRVYSQSIRLN